MALVSPVSLHSICCHRCHCHWTAPGVWHSVSVTAHLPGVSPWLHSPTRVTRSCYTALRCCTASLLLPGVSHGVTVTAQCTGCHCHCEAAGCHAVSLQLPWIVTQSHRQCPVQGLSHNAMSLRGPRGVTHCHCHCRPTVHHPVSLSLHGPRGVTHCHRHCTAWGATHRHRAGHSPVPTPAHRIAGTHLSLRTPPCHILSPPAVGHPRDSTAGSSSPNPAYSHPMCPWGC